MPPLTTNERWASWIDGLNFSLFGLLQSFIIFVFFVGDVLMTGRLVLIGALAIYDRFHRRKAVFDPELSAGSRGADSGLQRREGHRAHGAVGARLGLSRSCAPS